MVEEETWHEVDEEEDWDEEEWGYEPWEED
jgi:hypothetical protein